ncbi:Rpr2-domain-containing protein [Plenodomus tracheiphilus IPT5]|uniref:Rpr2-domain-containing protein n=1 Tax=Plenodomus tracheiphilus IPT5 TaxID=1408161 RepID=A0A6A7B5T9_9PLEO|nr:Rpr2-domain-containing protein [Plenodomus tracheiphilus IPT5]
MSKVKPPKAPKSKGIPNRHLHARTTFLYQAATYLTLQTSKPCVTAPTIGEQTTTGVEASLTHSHSPVALQLGSDLQQVSRKAQLRLAVDLKRSMCKSCNTILVPGQTATQYIENGSKAGKKPRADVLILECRYCTSKKRFPVGAKRQLKKSKRAAAAVETPYATTPEDVSMTDSTLPTGPEHTPHTD